MSELLDHAGSVLYRASLIIAECRERRPHRSETTAPPDGDPREWFELGLNSIVRVLGSADADRSYWTFLGPRPLDWWVRRLANEIAVHRVDAEQAAGLPTTLEALAAVDGIDEKLETYLPVVAQRRPAHRAIAAVLYADHVLDRGWTAVLGERVDVRREAGEGDVTIHADAATLYLWLWLRSPVDSVAVEGDLALAEAFRQASSV